MAGIRLESWSTLNRSDLLDRVSLEERRPRLTFEETQLLDAARERLRTWRAPSLRSKVMQEKKLEEQTDVTKAVVGEFVEDVTKAKAAKKQIADVTEAANEAEAEEAPKKSVTKAKTKKAAPAAKPAAKAANKKEAPVAKKTKTAKTNVKAKAAKSNGGKRIPDDAVLKVNKSFKNPFKEGSGPYKRFELCAKSDGKTYGTLRALSGLKPTTPLNFVRAKGGEFISKGK